MRVWCSFSVCAAAADVTATEIAKLSVSSSESWKTAKSKANCRRSGYSHARRTTYTQWKRPAYPLFSHPSPHAKLPLQVRFSFSTEWSTVCVCARFENTILYRILHYAVFKLIDDVYSIRASNKTFWMRAFRTILFCCNVYHLYTVHKHTDTIPL